ncbi:hypothetical protein Teth39_2117 [Thermoanaerobacter pseudethanolicus ATCC 33223]|uniref:Uncharacterized protein n=1 Tax=Thermoanaerobacter pseudethanolicus (strain ATCC 33223 / 39E) TaxID=340099 RepID=B0K7H4_THEP3|nr:hypothetical protein Teth514_0086 [Thermoanaerobacter sp. X514]ABY95740.1 hypothetical protein Teth39_2117 [Thermoanaerobacter pseudethanolicus ATCC 33223]
MLLGTKNPEHVRKNLDLLELEIDDKIVDKAIEIANS